MLCHHLTSSHRYGIKLGKTFWKGPSSLKSADHLKGELNNIKKIPDFIHRALTKENGDP